MSLFDYVLEHYSVYPHCLGYNYIQEIENNPQLVDLINSYHFVFVSSDFAVPIYGNVAYQFMTSAESQSSFMWLEQDYSHVEPFPRSEWTDVPTVGFVGRVPVFEVPTEIKGGGMGTMKMLHKGFEPRLEALNALNKSNEICCDFHVRMAPEGDSCGFWNESHPDFKRHGPLFKTNMLANQYQVCARGNANWSLRFYETLAAGRIPVYVESGGRTAADWWYGELKERKDELPFVYVEKIEDIEWEILKFHNSIDSIAEIQQLCVDFYHENYSYNAQIAAFESRFGHLKVK